MSNLEIDAPLLNGCLIRYHEKGESGRKAVEMLIGKDFREPPRSLTLSVHTQSGKLVHLTIP